MSFGDFIRTARVSRRLSLRTVAGCLGISAPYLCDVEYGRRKPFDSDKLLLLINILDLSRTEADTLYDLVGQERNTIPPDLKDYVLKRDYVSRALRTAKELDADESDWLRFVRWLKK